MSSPPLPDLASEHLVRHFGLKAFRPVQAEVISSVLSGRNTVVVMPTGAGKSLCYQLPATLLPGLTLVISPLIALMKDQVEQLLAKGIPATFINSTLTDIERADRINKLKSGAYKLVYVAPERFRSPTFVEALARVQVDLLAVDEAHCISQWGHDFRPDYALLGQARKRLRPPRTVALTATATPDVQADIAKSLLMKDPRIFVAGFDRQNLFLEVVSIRGDEDRQAVCTQLAQEEGSGIVYCSTRKAAETLHRALVAEGQDSVLYHAGMTEGARHQAQDTFMSRERAVAVATNAFGMGIDKPGLRFVAHANIPSSIEAYYQEIGRAGRDGKPARAVLLFNHADVFTQERLIQSNHPSEAVLKDIWHVLLSFDHFEYGVSQLAGRVGASEFEVSAALRIFEREGKIIRGVRGEGLYYFALTPKDGAAPQGGHAQKLLEALTSKYLPKEKVGLELAAISQLSQLSVAQVRQALGVLERTGALSLTRPFSGRTIRLADRIPFERLGLDLARIKERERHALLHLKRMTDYAYTQRCRRGHILKYFGEMDWTGPCQGCDVCTGARLKVPLNTGPVAKAGGATVTKIEYSELAAEELKRWRRDLARDLGVPSFIIFNDKTLYGLAAALPIDRSSFLSVKGTGESRWERFGAKVVEICLMARAAGHAPRSLPASERKIRAVR